MFLTHNCWCPNSFSDFICSEFKNEKIPISNSPPTSVIVKCFKSKGEKKNLD